MIADNIRIVLHSKIILGTTIKIEKLRTRVKTYNVFKDEHKMPQGLKLSENTSVQRKIKF